METDHGHERLLERLRAAFDAAEVFLDEPLGWPGVHEFEDRFGVELPEPYRSFVATVSDGVSNGPPDQGLVSLGEVPFDWPALDPGALARPFPADRYLAAGSGPDVVADARTGSASVHDGVLPLGGDGCDMYWAIVVTGPHRGHVWEIGGGGAQPFGREFGLTP